MKYKVGDKVRIKSKEEIKIDYTKDSEIVDKYSGLVATILRDGTREDDMKSGYRISINGSEYWVLYDFFEGISEFEEKTTLSEEMIKDISEVVNKHNLGVSISENDGKLIIEPLKVKDKQELEFGSPVMVSDGNEYWYFTNYGGGDKAFIVDRDGKYKSWKYIIEFEKFNPHNPEESLKYNIVK